MDHCDFFFAFSLRGHQVNHKLKENIITRNWNRFRILFLRIELLLSELLQFLHVHFKQIMQHL